MSDLFKRCGSCGEWKTRPEFLNSGKPPCRSCRNQWAVDYREKRKRMAFEHYGAKCVCCGEAEYVFLTFDHINGGGSEERRNNRKEPFTYERVIKENFPDRFQVLCFNCNWAKHKCGVCPHQEAK